MTSTSAHKRKAQYDPARQWGLKPEEPARGSTYIISGHVVGGANSDPRNMYVGETMGREGQAKAQRKSADDADRELKALLKRDRSGMRTVMLAREATKNSQKAEQADKTKPPERSVSLVGVGDISESSGKKAYKAEVVKQLGFDPTLKAGRDKADDPAVLDKVMSTTLCDTSVLICLLVECPGGYS
jgi:minichromosome maintenance protein 10